MNKHLVLWKKITTIRVLLALATSKDWKLWQMDVKDVFLHGELDREIYMNQPKGFESAANPNHVCKHRKTFFGLKQAPRAWYGKIAEFLTQVVIQLRMQTQACLLKKEKEN